MQLCGAGNEFCERLAFYGLATNLVIYLQTVMGADPASAATNLMVFEGTCYLTPLLGAWLADSLWGRYKTILVFSVIYMIVSPPALATVECLVLMQFRVGLPVEGPSCPHLCSET